MEETSWTQLHAALVELGDYYYPASETANIERKSSGIDIQLSRATYFDLLMAGALPLEKMRPSQLYGKKILDLGTGLGFLVLEPQVYFGIDVTGIDISFDFPLLNAPSQNLRELVTHLPNPYHPKAQVFYEMDALNPLQVSTLCPPNSEGCFDIAMSNASIFFYLGFNIHAEKISGKFRQCFHRLLGGPSLTTLNANLRKAFQSAFLALKPGGELWLSQNFRSSTEILQEAATLEKFQFMLSMTESELRTKVANAIQQSAVGDEILKAMATEFRSYHSISTNISALRTMATSSLGDAAFDSLLRELVDLWSSESFSTKVNSLRDSGDPETVFVAFRKPIQ